MLFHTKRYCFMAEGTFDENAVPSDYHFKPPPQKQELYATAMSFCLSVRLFVCRLERLSGSAWPSCAAAVSGRSAAGSVRPMPDTRTYGGEGLLRRPFGPHWLCDLNKSGACSTANRSNRLSQWSCLFDR